jgi:hypothetical protein
LPFIHLQDLPFIHLNLLVGNTPEIKVNSFPAEVVQAGAVILAHGDMGTDLFLAWSVVQIADVQGTENKTFIKSLSGVGAFGKEYEQRGQAIIKFFPDHAWGFAHRTEKDFNPLRHGQSHYFLSDRVCCQFIICYQQAFGPGERNPGFYYLSVNKAIVHSYPEHYSLKLFFAIPGQGA